MSSALENAEASTLIDNVDSTATPHSFDVLVWRELAFLEMKFGPHEAEAMSRTRVDLHVMRSLLAAGCSHTSAARILLGTCFEGEDTFDYTSTEVGVAAAAPAPVQDEDDGA